MNDNSRNDKLGAAKPLYSITWRDREYFLDFETQRVKGAFEAWAKSRAFRLLAETAQYKSPEEADKDRDALNARIDAGEYDLAGGEVETRTDANGQPQGTLRPNAIRRLQHTVEGQVAWIRIMFSKKHSDVTDADVRSMLADPVAKECLAGVLNRIAADSSPKSAGAAQ